MSYPVKLHEKEMTLIEGALIKADDGSAAVQMLLHKIQHKRGKLVALRVKRKQHDETERDHDEQRRAASYMGKRAAEKAKHDRRLARQRRVQNGQAMGAEGAHAVQPGGRGTSHTQDRHAEE